MTPTLTRLKALGLTARRFSALTETDPVTVSYWDRERFDKRRGTSVTPAPQWTTLLLDAWEKHPDLIPPEA